MIEDMLGKLVVDKYRVESLIRESDSGDLFNAVVEPDGSKVLLRILPTALSIDSRWAKRFLDEARAASTIQSEGILKVLDFGADARGITFAAYEPFSEETLADVLRSDGKLDQARALSIASQVADAAADAHELKALHGSLSPANIFVSDDSVKVLGFGADTLNVARDADPRYLSPEQSTNFPIADERSDIYSLGLIIYEMLAGEPAFSDTSTDDVETQRREPLTPISTLRTDLHKQIEPIVLAATSKDANERYQTMADLSEDIKRVLAEVGSPVRTTSAAVGRNLWQTAFVVLAGIVFLGGALIYFTLGKKTDPTTAMVVDANAMPVQPIGPATGAQEESLIKMIGDSDAAVMDPNMALPPGTIPGGDGYNAWANNGAPPLGAPPIGAPQTGVPPTGYVPPPGQTVTIDPNAGSPFMPNESGIILVPIPADTGSEPKATPTPKTGAANTAVPPSPTAAATPKPLATPPPRADKPTTKKPAATKPAKPGDDE